MPPRKHKKPKGKHRPRRRADYDHTPRMPNSQMPSPAPSDGRYCFRLMWYDPATRQLRATGHSVWFEGGVALAPDADVARRKVITELQTALDNLADDMRCTRVDSPAGPDSARAPGGTGDRTP